MSNVLRQLVDLVSANNGVNTKAELESIVAEFFDLTRERSVYYRGEFAIRFSWSKYQGPNFGNTVLALSTLKKFDDRPFIVCLVTPGTNYLLLANSTFLSKISQSSQQLTVDKIRGSFNGSDIERNFNRIPNTPENFECLFRFHQGIGFDTNLPRLVEATNNIRPIGIKFEVSPAAEITIMDAPRRAIAFMASGDAIKLKCDLDKKVDRVRDEILLAAQIDNTNVRGRIIEYLITGQDESIRKALITALKGRSKDLPQFATENELGDYPKNFPNFATQTDVKSKIMNLDSNPKAYNLDKMLEFLATPNSVFMFYFVGVHHDQVNTALVSMFQTQLLDSTILVFHWAGRNSRGVSQFEGTTIGNLIRTPRSEIDLDKAKGFLSKIIAL